MPIDNALLDELAEKISGGIKALGHVKGEVESQIRSTLEGVFANLDVVTGERMRVQEALLARLREEITGLEARIRALEEQHGKPS